MPGKKTVAVAGESTRLWETGNPGAFMGIGQISNEDPATQIVSVNYGSSDPGVAGIFGKGNILYPSGGTQTQYQEINQGTDPGNFWITCPPFPVAPDAIVPVGYVCDDENTAGVNGFLVEPFTQPAVSGTIAATFETTAFLANLDDDTARIYVTGGGLYTVVSIDSPTAATLRNLGIAAAIASLTF